MTYQRVGVHTKKATALNQAPSDPRKRLNEDRLRIFPDPDRPVAFVCECEDPGCLRTVVLTPAAYRALAGAPVLHESHRAGDS